MSLPTPYTLKDSDGKVMAHKSTDLWTWFPLQRDFNRKAYDAEAGGILAQIVNKLTATDDGRSALSQAACLESAGGTVPRDEFCGCLEAYIASQQTIASSADLVTDRQEKQEMLAWIENNIATARKAQASLQVPSP